MNKNPERTRQQAQAKMEEIKSQMVELDYVASGTLLARMIKCGKPTCRCAQHPDQRHGPYFDWTFRRKGRMEHQRVTGEQAPMLRAAIENYRYVLKLLRAWEHETRRIIEAENSRKAP